MNDINSITITGRVTADPEFKDLGETSQVCTLRIASNYKYGSGEQAKEKTTFVDVSCWNGLAKIMRDVARKGSAVIVQGRLELDQWEKDGQKYSKHFIRAEQIIVSEKGAASTSERGESSAPAARQGQRSAPQQPQRPAQGSGGGQAAKRPASGKPDDLPF